MGLVKGRMRVDARDLSKQWDLTGNVALITGARHGLGAATAVRLAQAGAHVCVTGRNIADLEPVVQQVKQAGGNGHPVVLNVSDAKSVSDAFENAIDHFGQIDIVVNNAALAIRKPLVEYQESEWDAVVNTNLKGTFLVSQAAGRHMIPRGRGKIINMSSTFARVAMKERAAYGASKAGVEHLTRMLAVEWGPHGVTVNAVAPTTVLTETRAAMFSDPMIRESRERQIPLGRLAEIEDVVSVVHFLCGAGSDFITGATVPVDGGFSALDK